MVENNNKLSPETKTKIEKQVDLLFNLLGYDYLNINSVNPLKVARVCGLSVEFKNLSNKKQQNKQGYIDLNEKKIVVDNINYDESMTRFVLAHEIGHFMLHGESGTLVRVDEKGKDLNDQEADFFAASLLMPKKVFKDAYDKLKQKEISSNAITSILAQVFKVPFESVERRIEEVNEKVA